ncbi:MAG: hypothetical protein LBD79_08895 [Treponema sp.]|nr:hypothetical protein [Treponema sp.]
MENCLTRNGRKKGYHVHGIKYRSSGFNTSVLITTRSIPDYAPSEPDPDILLGRMAMYDSLYLYRLINN